MSASARFASFGETAFNGPRPVSGVSLAEAAEGREGWRRERDSNPRKPSDFSGFQDRRLKPLGHLSVANTGGLKPRPPYVPTAA